MEPVVHSLHLRIKGSWRDAWLYKQSLVLWTREGHLEFVSLDDIRAQVSSEHGHAVAVAADYLIFRNDWKASGQFGDLLQIAGFRALFLAFLEGKSSLTLDLQLETKGSGNAPVHEGYALDTVAYGNRLLSATDSGLYETEFDPAFPDSDNPTLRLSDNPAYSIAARNGQFVVSQGDAGLTTREIAFGDGAEWWRAAEQQPLELVDDYSQRVAFSSYNVLNYRGEPAPTYLEAKTERVKATGSSRFDSTRIVGFKDPSTIEGILFASSDGASTTDIGPGRYVIGNAGYRLLVRDGDSVSVINLSNFKKNGVEASRNSAYKPNRLDVELANSALSTSSLSSGFLVETFGSVGLITERGSHVIIDEPRNRVRTFPTSRRYQDAFLAVDDSFVELVGFID